MRFLDSHVHLTEYESVGSIVEYSHSSETLLLSASVNSKTSARNLELGERFRTVVRPFVGIHPSEATKEPTTEWLEGALLRARGLGETGLDPRYSEVSERSQQMALFSAQLDLAERTAKPIQIHSRGAEEACLEKLSSYHLAKVLLHWFEGEDANTIASERGYYVSIGPAVLCSKKISRIATGYPEELILTESDGPVTFAALGGAGGPSLIPSVVFCLAGLRKKKFGEMAEIVLRNGSAFLG